MKKTIITVAFASTMAGCSIGPKLPSLADPEASFYEQRCGTCHTAIPAEEYKAFQWERLLTLLERQLEPDHKQLTPLTNEEKTRLYDYLNNYAKPDEDISVEQMQEQLRALGDSPQ